MSMVKLKMLYRTNGIQKVLEFNAVSMSRLQSKEFTFGVPQRIKRLFGRKSFILDAVKADDWDGLSFIYSGLGYSVNGHNLFLHFASYRV